MGKLLDVIQPGRTVQCLPRLQIEPEIVLISEMIQITGFYDPYKAGLVISLVRAACCRIGRCDCPVTTGMWRSFIRLMFNLRTGTDPC
ncbi:MAG: hypothetical protein BWY80_00438 [Firmicutes bacterium ADurb.Bin456]|nr:MAG: hypothetical protein BWY80_00438 [Firmicutes bacterium ADurb.Bin456]